MIPQQATVVIPAHDEEAVISRTLRSLLPAGSDPGMRVLVVCNGCRDGTAQRVRREFPAVGVIELDVASKIAALNAGLAAAAPGTVLLLDADIELEAAAAHALLEAAAAPGVEAAIGHMDVDATGAAYAVRAFYRVWREHPYLRHGKFAAAIALSAAGRERVGTLPMLTADDTYLRRLIPSDSVVCVPGVRFIARAPRTFGALLRVRTRSQRGNRELDRVLPAPRAGAGTEAGGLLRRVLVRPALWPDLPVYLAVALAARLEAQRAPRTCWERDETSRELLSGVAR